MKIIEVNKFCEINQENIAPSVEDRIIAINIVQKDKDEKGFINFCLAIDSYQRCCESFGGDFVKTIDYDEENVYVSKIETGVDLTEEEIKKYLDVDDFDCGGYHACKVYGKENELISVAFVVNIQNGYYDHCLEATLDGNIIYSNCI